MIICLCLFLWDPFLGDRCTRLSTDPPQRLMPRDQCTKLPVNLNFHILFQTWPDTTAHIVTSPQLMTASVWHPGPIVNHNSLLLRPARISHSFSCHCLWSAPLIFFPVYGKRVYNCYLWFQLVPAVSATMRLWLSIHSCTVNKTSSFTGQTDRALQIALFTFIAVCSCELATLSPPWEKTQSSSQSHETTQLLIQLCFW